MTPAAIPTRRLIASAAATASGGVESGRPGTAACSTHSTANPNATPAIPPATASAVASIRKRRCTATALTPRARSRPISPVRSWTEIHMIVRMPIAPTNSEIPAIAVTAAVMIPMMRPNVSSISVCVVTVKSSLSRCRAVSTVLTRAIQLPLLGNRPSATTSDTAPASRAITSMARSSVWLNTARALATGMYAASSRSKPSSCPLDSSTPITRNPQLPIRTRRPSGDASPNSSRASFGPSTANEPLRCGSIGGRNVP